MKDMHCFRIAVLSLAMSVWFAVAAQGQAIPPAESPVYLLAGRRPIHSATTNFKLVSWRGAMRSAGIPSGIIAQLEDLEGLPFFGRPRFKLALRATLGEADADAYFPAIAKFALAHPHPNPLLPPTRTTITAGDGGSANKTTIMRTGASNFRQPAPYDAFTVPPGTNMLPTVFSNLYDGFGREMPNTLPSTKLNPYNLHDGDPIVSEINPTSPTDDLLAIAREVTTLCRLALNPPEGEGPIDAQDRQQAIVRRLQTAIDILEGNFVPDRAYSGFPLLHYNGPNKIKHVTPTLDANGNTVGGNVDIHQIWYDDHIESDTSLLNPADVWDVPWTVTYTVDVLSRGHDDFSPFAMFTDDPTINNPGFQPPPPARNVPHGKWPGQETGLPHYGMDQSFYPMKDGTRTIFKIKMPPGKYYHLVYTWGWRMHPPRIQSTDRATKTFPDPDRGGQEKTLVRWETDVFGEDPMGSAARRLAAIRQIGDLSPAKRMWNHFRAARTAAERGRYRAVIRRLTEPRAGDDSALQAFHDWNRRGIMRLPRGAPVDSQSDLTLLFVNNTIYGQFADGGIVDFPKWKLRAADDEDDATVKVTIYNGDYFRHAYVNVDFGGSRGWENIYKSSVQVGGSGCWFTFGRANWWINNTEVVVEPDNRDDAGQLQKSGPVTLPPARPGRRYLRSVKENVQQVKIIFNYEPSRRLRFYQFDPTHHDVSIMSIH